MDDQGLKRRILELLSSQDATKEQIKNTLFIQSDKTLNLLLKELQAEHLIFRHGAVYSLVKKESTPKKPHKKSTKKGFSKEDALSLVFLIICFGTSAVSIRNTSIFTATVFSVPFCYLLSGVMTLFMLGAMSAIIHLWKQRRYALATAIAPIWIIVTAFSMFCTVEGMYSIQKDNFIEAEVVQNIDKTNEMLYNEYIDKEQAIQAIVDAKQITLDRYNREISEYNTQTLIQENLKNYNRLSWNISVVEKEIREQTIEKAKIADERIKLLEKQADKKIVVKTFYEQVGELFKVRAFLLQFIVSCFAAIIVDILSPISLSVAMYLKEEK